MKQYIEIPIVFAIIGFILSLIILTGNNRKGTSAFNEVEITNGISILQDFVRQRITAAGVLYEKLQKDVTKLANDPNVSSEPVKTLLAAKKDSLQKTVLLLRNSGKELGTLQYGNPDTAVNYLQPYFSINRETLFSTLNGIDSVAEIPIRLTDTATVLAELYATKKAVLNIRVKNDFTIIAFTSRYSSFGLWLFLSVAQMTVWFLLCPLIIGKAWSTKNYKGANVLLNLILPVCVLGVFLLFLFKYLNDFFIIKDTFFLRGFNFRMTVYALFGYLAAAVCFSIFLYASKRFNEGDKDEEFKKLSKAADGTPTKNEDYLAMESLFESAFMSTAVILTIFVLWAGVLFTAINSMAVMRYYQSLSGKPFLNPDIVYLLGLFHTLLLLIFYIPVKLKFNSLKVVQDANAATSGNDKKILGFLSESLGTILVTASPLIVSLVQKAAAAFLQ